MATRPTRAHIDPRRLWRRCVTQKVSYDTREAALQGAEEAMDAGKVEPGCHLTPYECADCGRWHLRNRQIVWP